MTIPGLSVTRVAVVAIMVALIAAILIVSTTSAAPTVTTDMVEYHPDDTAVISGTGYTSGQFLDIVVIRPDLSIVTGDGTETPGVDTVTANGSGAFTYNYILNGIFGLYTVNVYDNLTDPGHTTVLATTTFLDDAGPAECFGGPTTGDNQVTPPADGDPTIGDVKVTAPSGEVVTGICIKSGTDTFDPGSCDPPTCTTDHSGLITADGIEAYGIGGCYTVTGIGMNMLTVTVTTGASPPCKEISHIDFFTAVPPTTTATFKVTKTFNDSNLSEISVTLTCTSGTISTPNPDTTVGQMVTFTITGFTDPGTTCTATESGVPSGYTTDNSACLAVGISDTVQSSCTVTNTNFATFKVTKTFSDGNLAEVTITLSCTSGTIDPPNPDTTVGQMVTFTIRGFTDPGTNCTATESGVPDGYTTVNSDCQDDDPISPGAQSSCTIANTLNIATFKVTKTFSDGNLAEVTITLSCTSGTIDPPNPDTTAGQMVTFTIRGFIDPGTTCTATESLVPGGYITDNSACLTLGISAGVQTSCTIFNEVSSTLKIIKDVDPDDPTTNWNFDISGPTSFSDTISGDGMTAVIPVEPGAYTITETAGAGTDLNDYVTSFSCTGASPDPMPATGEVISVTIDAGESVICTFKNTDPRLKIVKDVVPDDSTTNWNFDISGPTSFTDTIAGDGMTDEAIVAPGSYIITETAGANTNLGDYDTTYSCTGASPSPSGSGTVINVTIDLGEFVVCTFTNTAPPTSTPPPSPPPVGGIAGLLDAPEGGLSSEARSGGNAALLIALVAGATVAIAGGSVWVSRIARRS